MRTRPLLLDGAMGTALLAAGLPAGAPPEEWLFSHPDRVRAVHAAHVGAGARLVLSCTFNLASARLGDLPVGDVARAAVRVARDAGAGRVAGAVGPSSGLRGGYERAFTALARAGADLLWVESQYDLDEALAALDAARATGLECVVTFTPRDDCEVLPGGGRVLEALLAAERAGAAAVGLNCVEASAALESLVRDAARRLPVPLVAKPTAGLPGRVLPPAEFSARLAALASAGAEWIGGCCGATADHLRG